MKTHIFGQYPTEITPTYQCSVRTCLGFRDYAKLLMTFPLHYIIKNAKQNAKYLVILISHVKTPVSHVMTLKEEYESVRWLILYADVPRR